jgi:hypothetical protein
VTVEVKDAYTSRVRALAASAGWAAASACPAESAWSSPTIAHSWTERDVEQPAEEADKQQAEKQPAFLHFQLPKRKQPVSGDKKSS